jgi:uncharacterized membrane protein
MAIPGDIDIGLAVDLIRPGANYKRYHTYEELALTWQDKIQALPTEQEIIDAWQLIIEEQNKQIEIGNVKDNAKTQFRNIPNWASWTEDETLTWFDANVTNASSALPVMRNMIRMLIALRNEVYPDLQE